MGIQKEYLCPGHGPFESDRPVCPRGCTVAEREFRTAPAYHNGKTSRTDDLIRSQVEAFGLSDIRSAREGETARIPTAGARRQAEFQAALSKKYPSNWAALPKGENAIPAVLAAHNAPATDATAALRGSKPKYEAVRDPACMKVDVTKAA